MFQFIENIFSGTWSRLQLTIEKIRWMLIAVLGATAIGIVPAFCGASVKLSIILAIPLWIFSFCRIFSPLRYIYIAIFGEGTDAFRAVCNNKENERIWDSELAAKYRQVIINMWLAQTIIFLFAPLYFNFTSGGRGWLPIIIMVMFATAMISVKAIQAIFSFVACITIAVLLTFAVHDMFPQVSMIPGVAEASAKLKAGKMAGENARALEDVGVLREKQRQLAVSEVIRKIAEWQGENPGKDIPEYLNMELKAAKAGMTFSEYKIRKAPKEQVLEMIKTEINNGRKIEEFDDYCQRLWAENEAKIAIEKAAGEKNKIETKMVTISASQDQTAITQSQLPTNIDGRWMLIYGKPAGYVGRTAQRYFAEMVCIKQTDNGGLRLTYNSLVFIGEKASDGSYEGVWTNNAGQGTFKSLTFSENSAAGMIITSDGIEIPMKLRRV